MAMQEAGIGRSGLQAIGVGAPGPLNLKTGVIPTTPNLQWRNANVRAAFEKAFACPTVVLNDVDAGVYGEYRFGAAQNVRCVVGIFPGTGIGGGCVYEGTILRGRTWSCLEIGHLPVLPDGPLCGCGRRGCLEAVASRLAISAAAVAAAYRGRAPHLLKTVGMSLADVRSGALAESVAHGDREVERILRTAAQWIGVAAAGVINLLLPDVLLLGGGLVEEMPELFRSEVETAARERVMPAFRRAFQVKVAEILDDAAAIGAAAWARQVVEGPARRPRAR